MVVGGEICISAEMGQSSRKIGFNTRDEHIFKARARAHGNTVMCSEFCDVFFFTQYEV